MLSKRIQNWLTLALVAALAPTSGAFGQDESPIPPVAPPQVAQEVNPGAIPHVRLALEGGEQEVFAYVADESGAGAGGAPPSEYWIGIALGELPEVAKKQLKLEHGLVVEDVLPDSPAAKAEFKPHDVLVRVGDLALHQPADILKAVDEAKDKEMRIVILRDGQEATLKVTAAKRPKPEATKVQTLGARVPESAIQRIEEALRELKAEGGGKQQLGLYFAHPGVVARGTTSLKAAELPKNLAISITREGDAPAKVHVKRDDKEWNVTADKLSELPDDVRSHVEQMLTRVLHPIFATKTRTLVVGGQKEGPEFLARWPVPQAAKPGVPPTAAQSIPAPATARLQAYRVQNRPDGVERKVDLILKKLESPDNSSIEQLKEEVKKLRKEVDELRNK